MNDLQLLQAMLKAEHGIIITKYTSVDGTRSGLMVELKNPKDLQ